MRLLPILMVLAGTAILIVLFGAWQVLVGFVLCAILVYLALKNQE